MSDHKRLTDVLFKLFALHQFFAAHKKHERAVWRTQHTVDFIDSDIAVLSGFFCRECHFQVDRHLADGILHLVAPFVEYRFVNFPDSEFSPPALHFPQHSPFENSRR